MNIIDRYVAGDPEALEHIYGEHRQRLLLVAYGICRHREVARDAVQDVFEKLCSLPPEKRQAYFGQEGSSLEAWLRVAVRNRVNDILKVSTARKKKTEDNRSRYPVSEPNGVDEALARERFEALMGQLRFRQREVMTLHVMGFRNEEIARLLDLTYNTVKNNIYEARLRLRHHWRAFMD